MPRLIERLPAAARSSADVLLLLTLACSASLTLAAYYGRTTFLLGCFMGGVSFASVPGARLRESAASCFARGCSHSLSLSRSQALEAWEKAVPPVSDWSSRVFFASIGFAVPAGELFAAEALGTPMHTCIRASAARHCS